MPKKYSYWVHSGKYSMLQKIFVLLFGVLSFMLIARALSPNELGVWGLFLIISSIVETLRNALIKNAYVLFINTWEPEDHPGIEYAAILTNIIYSLLFICLFLLLGPVFENVLNAYGLSTLLNYYCITLILLIPFSYLEIFLISRIDFKSTFWMYFTRGGLMLAGVAVYYFSGHPFNFPLIAIIYLGSVIIGLLTGIITSRRYKRPLIRRNNKISYQFMSFGKYVFSNNLFSLVFRSTDSFMAASFISTAASAIYTTCARITNLVDMPSQVFADIMFPKAAQVMKNKDREGIKRIYENAVAATLTFTIPIILVILLFPGFLLYIVAGKEYVKAAPILQIVVFYGFFLPFIKQFGNITDVLGMPKINSILMAIFAFISITFNLIGIYFFGLYGSAYATLFSYFLLFITTQIILKKLLNISHRNIFRSIFLLYPEYMKLVRNFFTRSANAIVK